MDPSSPLPDPAALLADALARHQRGDLAGAEKEYRALLAVDPKHVDAIQYLGVLFGQQGRFAEAEVTIRRALDVQPGMPNALFNLALTLQNLGRHGEAVALYRQLQDAGASSADLWLNLGNAYSALQRVDDAVAAYESAIRLAPNDATPLINLADLLRLEGRIAAPIRYLERALALRPQAAPPRRLLAVFYQLNGEADRAVAERETLVRQAPDNEGLHRELILDLNLAEGDDGSRTAAACREWHRRFAAPLAPARPKLPNTPDPERRLRIGYVGGNQLRYHTLRDALLPIVRAQDRSAFELFGYSDLPPEREDSSTAEYRRYMTWRQTGGLADPAFAEAVMRDRIDVLIDPVGMVGGSRLLALARRPAPIQISFPLMGTCGGDTMDYVVADDHILPREEEGRFAERILRVPFAYCRSSDLTELPPVGALPARATGGSVTFGSMNSLPKIGPRTLRLWGQILSRVPNARLLIKAGFPFRDADVRQGVMNRLTAAGVAAERVILVPWTTNQAGHIDVYNRIDIALDSLPYVGVTTTFESLSMGVPVVTRVGKRVLERYGLSILKTVGFEEGITWSDDDYVARAVALASDPDRLESLRRSLRGRLLASPACDARGVAASIEAAIRTAWREWCAQSTAGGR